MTAGGGRKTAVRAASQRNDHSEGEPNGNASMALQMMMARSNHRDFLDVVIEGQKLRFYYKQMLWTAKSRCVSAATETTPVYNEKTKQLEIKAKIHFDIYMRECLKAMLVEPPFPITDTVIDAFTPEIGSQFESIIPDLFDTVEKIETAKKESELPSNGEQTPAPIL